ncbi:MAG: hypothetical protein WCQ21_28770 [Verrucomicrobiota bacterium]|jgi:hypothetical protein
MNNSKGKDTQAARPAEQQLQAYLEEAVEAGANAIVLEYVPEGLEVSFMLGNTGAGLLLKDAKLAGAPMQLIGDRAGLDTKAQGKMTWLVHGQPVKIAVEEYDSFGECAFRLKLKKTSPLH